MPAPRKRSLEEATSVLEEPSLLHRVRNMWQFANLCQWIYIFGKAVKIDDRFDTDTIETECLKPDSQALQEIGLALLKNLSSFRGLTHEVFDEYLRRQYVSKAPEQENPFGMNETPARFADFDALTKIRILQQMTIWTMRNAERIREKMEETKDTEQSQWRIEPMGWDSEDRIYYVLDDNRIYRMTEAPLPASPVPTKRKAKTSRKGSRASKRRRVSENGHQDDDTLDVSMTEQGDYSKPVDDGLGGMQWECLAVTADEARQLVASFAKTRDENERILRGRLQEHLLPILEKQEESRKRKDLQRERELLNLAKMANAKRSSRLAGKQERQKFEEQAREEAQRHKAEETEAKKLDRERARLEKEREARLMSRENRLKDREARRELHERDLASLSEGSRQSSQEPGRLSERRRLAEIEKKKQALVELDQEDEEDDWIFDCVCGVYGQVDDGTHSVACDTCNVWQHSKCVGISEDEAEQSDFRFVCGSCRQREFGNQAKPRTTIKLKVKPREDTLPSAADKQPRSQIAIELSSRNLSSTEPKSDDAEELGTTTASNTATANVSQFGASSSFTLQHDTSTKLDSARDSNHTAPKQITADGKSAKLQITPASAGNLGLDKIGPVTPGANFRASFDDPKAYFSNGGSSPIKHTTAGSRSGSPIRDTVLASSPITGNSHLLATPSLPHEKNITDPAHHSTLPSSESGVSPTKHSPAPLRPESASSAFSKSGNFPAVFPPITTLAPSPQQPILTPPKKHSEPPRSEGPRPSFGNVPQ